MKLSNLDKVFWPDDDPSGGITKGDLIDYYRAVAEVLVPHLKGRPFTMRRYPGRRLRQGVLPEGRAEGHAGVDPALPRAGLDPRAPAEEALDRRAPRERRGRADVDGQHGVHRHERVVLTRRQARSSRLRVVRSRPVPGRRLSRGRAGRARRQAGTRRDRPCRLPEDEQRGRHACAGAGRAALHVRPDAGVLRDRGGGARAHPSRARDDGVVEGEAARRPDRREPERRGEDDRVGLLGAASPWGPGLDSIALGGGRRVARRRPRSRWRSCSSASAATATCSKASSRRGNASNRPCAPSAEGRLPADGRDDPLGRRHAGRLHRACRQALLRRRGGGKAGDGAAGGGGSGCRRRPRRLVRPARAQRSRDLGGARLRQHVAAALPARHARRGEDLGDEAARPAPAAARPRPQARPFAASSTAAARS